MSRNSTSKPFFDSSVFGIYGRVSLKESDIDYSKPLFISNVMYFPNDEVYEYLRIFKISHPETNFGVVSSPHISDNNPTVTRVVFGDKKDLAVFDAWAKRVKDSFWGGQNPTATYPVLENGEVNGVMWTPPITSTKGSREGRAETWAFIVKNASTPVYHIRYNTWLFSDPNELTKLTLILDELVLDEDSF